MSTLVKRGLTLSLSVLSTQALASVVPDRVVYGNDDRLEVFEAAAPLQSVAKSTAAMIPVGAIRSAEGAITLTQDTLASQGVCSDDPYANQPTPGMCSGFLVGPDLLVTAGHCVNRFNSCESNNWVFDFKVDETTGRAGVNVDPSTIYKCKKLVNVQLNNWTKADYALVQLDRIVEDRAPLKFRSEGAVADGAPIVVIGHPMGLPTKIAAGANVRTNSHAEYFVANLDTFGGNSGSAVFNVETLVVEGILVRGETDYTYNRDKGCQEIYRCDDDKCRGEDVSRITSIMELALRDAVMASVAANDTTVLASYLEKKGWVDLYDNARESILMKIAQAQALAPAQLLLQAQVLVNDTDLSGKTALHHLADQSMTSEDGAEIFTLLLSKEAALNAQDKAGETALIKAVKKNNLKMVELLLANGADVRLSDGAGKTAIDYTKFYNLKQRKVRALLKKALNKKA